MDQFEGGDAKLAITMFKVIKTLSKVAEDYKYDFSINILNDILIMIDESQQMWEEQKVEYKKEK